MEKKMEMQRGIYNVFLKQEFVRNMELLTTEEPLYPRDGGSFIDYESDRVSWWEIDDLTIATNGWPKVWLGTFKGTQEEILDGVTEKYTGFPREAFELMEISAN